jgi:hypothetical protein
MTTSTLSPPTTNAATLSSGNIMKAYDTFGNAAKEGALKVILKNDVTKITDNLPLVVG